jgi:hypothetical protein
MNELLPRILDALGACVAGLGARDLATTADADHQLVSELQRSPHP